MRARSRVRSRLEEPEVRYTRPAYPPDSLVPIGDLDVVVGMIEHLDPDAVVRFTVQVVRSNFFGPLAVRIQVTDFLDRSIDRRVDIRKVEIAGIAQLGAMIPSETWDAPGGCAVGVPLGHVQHGDLPRVARSGGPQPQRLLRPRCPQRLR